MTDSTQNDVFSCNLSAFPAGTQSVFFSALWVKGSMMAPTLDELLRLHNGVLSAGSTEVWANCAMDVTMRTDRTGLTLSSLSSIVTQCC